MLGGVKNKAPVSRNHRGLAKSLVGTPRRGPYQQHLLTPPLSQALAARFSPLEPDVNKPRGSHIKVVGHRSRGGYLYPAMKFPSTERLLQNASRWQTDLSRKL